MYNHNKAQQSENRVHISWDILYKDNDIRIVSLISATDISQGLVVNTIIEIEISKWYGCW